MSFYGLPDGISFNGFFGSSNYGKTTGSNLNFLSDYAAIQNGSYRKLMNAYYKGNSKVEPLVHNTATSKESAKKLAAVESHAEDLKKVADELYKGGSKSVFQQTEIKQEDGTTKKGYDVDAIYKKVSQFVKSYNDMIACGSEVKSKSMERAIENLKMVTDVNERLLSKAGITVKSDGTLQLDEETFRKGDMGLVKDIFQGTGSYAYQVSVKASMIDYAAQREASKANTYNRYGGYSNNYNYFYNDYF